LRFATAGGLEKKISTATDNPRKFFGRFLKAIYESPTGMSVEKRRTSGWNYSDIVRSSEKGRRTGKKKGLAPKKAEERKMNNEIWADNIRQKRKNMEKSQMTEHGAQGSIRLFR